MARKQDQVRISAGMALGMSRELAARFSFLLAVPAIAGAGLFLIVDAIAEESLDGHPMVAPGFVSTVSATQKSGENAAIISAIHGAPLSAPPRLQPVGCNRPKFPGS